MAGTFSFQDGETTENTRFPRRGYRNTSAAQRRMERLSGCPSKCSAYTLPVNRETLHFTLGLMYLKITLW